jgi:hypothetical protein
MNIKVKYLLPLITLLVVSQAVRSQEITAETVIAKHLDSIGSLAKRQSLKNIFAAGAGGFESKLPVIKGIGKAVIVSDPNDLYFLMGLNSREYPFEKIGIFGTKVSLPFTTGGSGRSPLGAFLAEHSGVLTDDLFCGGMSMRWIKGLADSKKLKFKYAGTRKIDGVDAHVLDILLAGGGSDDFTVRAFFNAENFHHIRTEYHRETQIGSLTFGQRNQTSNSKLDLVEEFSDFRESDGLTFPFFYRVTFRSNSATQVFETSWHIRFQGYYLNQNLASDFFTFDVKQK